MFAPVTRAPITTSYPKRLGGRRTSWAAAAAGERRARTTGEDEGIVIIASVALGVTEAGVEGDGVLLLHPLEEGKLAHRDWDMSALCRLRVTRVRRARIHRMARHALLRHRIEEMLEPGNGSPRAIAGEYI